MGEQVESPVGVVLCCHGDMGAGMCDAAEMIVGPQTQLATVGIHPGDGRDKLIGILSAAIAEVDAGAGVLVLTDMAGGTPCNLVAAMPPSNRIEMVTGFNLPALLQALRTRKTVDDLARLADSAVVYGCRHITSLRSLLEGSAES